MGVMSPLLLRFLVLLWAFIGWPTHASLTQLTHHNDALGSPIAATDAAGNLLWRESYRPYGERLTNPAAGSNNPLWYTGKRQDAETGLVYMGARYYDPRLGRFLSIDPVEPDENNLHSLNRYAYANNNPTRFTDPDGKIPIDTIWDAGNVLYDLGKAAYGAATNNPALVSQGLADAAADGVAMLIPYAPAGSTKVARKVVEGTEGAGSISKTGRRGGESAEAAAGRLKHQELSDRVAQKPGWRSEPKMEGLDGKFYKPDVVTPRGRILELKPNTPSGRAAGKRQVENYQNQLGVRGRVIYYEPKK